MAVGVPTGVLGAILVVASAAIGRPLLPLVGAAAVCALGLAIARPLPALYVGILLIAADAFSLPVGASRLHAYQVMFIITAVGWLIRKWSRHEPISTASPLLIPSVLLVVSTLAGLALVPNPGYAVRIPIMWSVFVVLYQMVVVDGDTNTVRNIAVSLCLAGAVTGVLAITQTGARVCGPTSCTSLATAQESDPTGSAARATTSAFAQPNRLGEFLALAIPFQLGFAVGGSLRLRLLGLGCLPASVFALALSLSREAVLALGAALLFLLATWPPFRRWVSAGILLVAFVVVIGANPVSAPAGSQSLTERIASIGQVGSDPRVIAYKRTPEIITDHPILGVGPDQYAATAARYGIVDPTTGLSLIHAHNIALNFTAEHGLTGLAALVWWFVALARVLARVGSRQEARLRGLALATVASFLTLFVGGFADYSWQQNNLLALTFVLAGGAVVLARANSRWRKGTQRPRLSAGSSGSSYA